MAPVRRDDPTLPKPWAQLAEGDTVYYWNEETGQTQYERPALPKSSQPSQVQTPARSSQHVHIAYVPLFLARAQMHARIAVVCSIITTQHPQAHNGYHESSGVPPTSQGPVSADEFRRQHHLSVHGDTAPEPYQLFEQAPFSPDIMDEVPLFDTGLPEGTPGGINPARSHAHVGAWHQQSPDCPLY